MVMTDSGKSGLALILVGSGYLPRYCAIGSGSGTPSTSDTTLLAENGSRADFTTRDISIQKEVTFTYDFNSVRMSGVALSEFGLLTNQVIGSGTLFNREGFGAVPFDGTNELQIQITYEFI